MAERDYREAHAEVRSWEPDEHESACPCEVCKTVSAVCRAIYESRYTEDHPDAWVMFERLAAKEGWLAWQTDLTKEEEDVLHLEITPLLLGEDNEEEEGEEEREEPPFDLLDVPPP